MNLKPSTLNHTSKAVVSACGKPFDIALQVPGDKSISHRAILLSAIHHSSVTITNLSSGQDVWHAIRAIQALGVRVDLGDYPKLIVVHGVGLHGLSAPKAPIDCGNSGTLMRLLMGLLSAQPFESELCGDVSLSTRPMARAAEPLRQMGADISLTNQEYPPIRIRPVQALVNKSLLLKINSAQVKSALLLAGLYGRGSLQLQQRPTRDHTERMLAHFGADIKVSGEEIFLNPSELTEHPEIVVPSDMSSASFAIGATVLTPGASLSLRQVGINPGRMGYLNTLMAMGADITLYNQEIHNNEPVADLLVRYSSTLRGLELSAERVIAMIDEIPILSIVCACASGDSIISGLSELRFKESDRLQGIIEGLAALGVVTLGDDEGLRIVPSLSFQSKSQINCFHDHRMAMSFILASLRSPSALELVNIDNINTSYPEFFNLLEQIGVDCSSLKV